MCGDGIRHGTHGVAGSSGGMKVDEGRPSGRLGETIRHSEHNPFMQSEDIPEIRRKVLQERQFVRARIAEDRRQAVLAKKVVGGCVNRFHGVIP